ncbi:MAG: hypothetical protein K9H16_09920 [Bacteroidales bacterium]|nr:hypothetical protein [Bacteroidales bacterium]
MIFNHLSDKLTLCQMSPGIMRKIPFSTPSIWLETPILGFANMGTKSLTIRPEVNRRTPKKMS